MSTRSLTTPKFGSSLWKIPRHFPHASFSVVQRSPEAGWRLYSFSVREVCLRFPVVIAIVVFPAAAHHVRDLALCLFVPDVYYALQFSHVLLPTLPKPSSGHVGALRLPRYFVIVAEQLLGRSDHVRARRLPRLDVVFRTRRALVARIPLPRAIVSVQFEGCGDRRLHSVAVAVVGRSPASVVSNMASRASRRQEAASDSRFLLHLVNGLQVLALALTNVIGKVGKVLRIGICARLHNLGHGNHVSVTQLVSIFLCHRETASLGALRKGKWTYWLNVTPSSPSPS
ncbi:hypothetical protein HDK90DRAFT_158251 [Phyllosticta capitalensis]|uniref:Uncharacterized protein n=1 Tax=Phyllosticta capitalensis TaxID=121624 RepID=A0ABR1Z120_9PEZI